jgi:hypothetical protein
MGFPRWEPASRCTGGPTQGALALMRWFVEEYGDQGGYNLGIYNCRSVRGGSTTSLHGEGRALDLGFPVGDPDGDELTRRLLKVPGRLGVQAIIYERKIYSALSPGGRYYGGVNPHADHLHVELTRESASELTYATVVDVMTPGLPRHRRGSRVLRVGMTGTDVRWLQRRLNRENATNFSGAERLADDGAYGPKTAQAVQRFERAHSREFPRLIVDGTTGTVTWKALGVTPAMSSGRKAA